MRIIPKNRPPGYHFPHTSHRNTYAAPTATTVNGMPSFIKCVNFTGYPSFFNMPQATMLADAPMGVMLPHRLAPMRSPNKNSDGSTLMRTDIEMATGSMAARNGTLSIKADNITDTTTMTV